MKLADHQVDAISRASLSATEILRGSPDMRGEDQAVVIAAAVARELSEAGMVVPRYPRDLFSMVYNGWMERHPEDRPQPIYQGGIAP